ncbi:hypothetical protein BDV06DRAFT_229395 [Aspergillus oleicola]
MPDPSSHSVPHPGAEHKAKMPAVATKMPEKATAPASPKDTDESKKHIGADITDLFFTPNKIFETPEEIHAFMMELCKLLNQATRRAKRILGNPRPRLLSPVDQPSAQNERSKSTMLDGRDPDTYASREEKKMYKALMGAVC